MITIVIRLIGSPFDRIGEEKLGAIGSPVSCSALMGERREHHKAL